MMCKLHIRLNFSLVGHLNRVKQMLKLLYLHTRFAVDGVLRIPRKAHEEE